MNCVKLPSGTYFFLDDVRHINVQKTTESFASVHYHVDSVLGNCEYFLQLTREDAEALIVYLDGLWMTQRAR